MPATYSFDFGHRFLPLDEWHAAFLVYSEDNVFTPHPDALAVQPSGEGWLITADRFACAGLQQQAPGAFRAAVQRVPGGFDCSIHADLTQRIKGTTILLRHPPLTHVPTRDYGEAACKPDGDLLHYPRQIRLPVFPLRRRDGSFTAIASLDEQVRGKAVAVVPLPQQPEHVVIELHHHEDARQWSTHQQTPTWRVLHCADPAALFEARCQLAQRAWGLKPWDQRDDVPPWLRQVGLVLNLHGMHWTGYVFNTYAQQLEAIRYVAQRLDGRHVLAFLAAWDGRYNYNWPRYEADPRMGGHEGLRALVQGAQALGVHVVPQIGAVSANRRFLPPALHDAGCQDAFGNVYVKDVDWDNDRAPDTYRVNANLGHPGFRQFLLDQTRTLRQTYGFDGIFLDINMHFSNDPRFSIVEGHRAFAAALRQFGRDFLLFGENWYDALLPIYPLVHSVTGPRSGLLQRWPDIFDRYARTTYHLIHPSPSPTSLGSSGVYEAGYVETFDPDPQANAIPTLSVTHDTLTEHRAAIDRHVEIARTYLQRLGL